MKEPITIATLHLATPQQVFDQVVAHLRKQGVPSKDGDSCLYRNSNGLKCAAGCLISDEEYHEEMDCNGEDTSWEFGVLRGKFPSAHKELIQSLQFAHDGNPSGWEGGFEFIAAQHNLQFKGA